MNSFRAFCFVLLSVIALVLASACIPPLTPEQQEIIDELNQRDLPAWYDESKFGIFIHWGPYAVPAFAPIEGSINDALANHYGDFLLHMPYVEWYWNALQTEGSATHQYHVENYGEDYSYDNFGRIFREGINEWNPDEWADLFDTAGAKYVVLVTKHHDGFLMWPSEQTNPNKQDWYSERDIVGELAHAVRERGMRFGVYYSGGLDWAWNERSARNLIDLAATMPLDTGYLHYVETHFRELIDRYEPSVLWNDINYPSNEGLWEMERDYYEAVSEGVVNDRFMVLAPIIKWLKFPFLRNFIHNLLRYFIIIGGNDLAALEGDPPPHCDFRTLEYVAMEGIRQDKVEVTRGMGFGFGYNRMESDDDTLSEEELIHGLIDTVSKNGNLLLNVGPKSNGDIPDIQMTRLQQLGNWLSVNGSALYGSRPWVRAEGETDSGDDIRFTQNEDTVFAIVLNDLSSGPVRLINIEPDSLSSVELLGYGPVTWDLDGTDIVVELPDEENMQIAYSLALHR